MNDTKTPAKKKVLITRQCFIDGEKKRPGTIIEVPAALAGGIFHAGKGTFDLSLASDVKKEYEAKQEEKAKLKFRLRPDMNPDPAKKEPKDKK